MKPYRILWIDDEIELLKPHIMFLRSKGYEVATAASGVDALAMAAAETFDIVLLDEQMPGISGLDTLARLKERWPRLPVVMITKSEEESIMDQAIGSKIADYLIKPVNPSQILLTLKKLLHSPQIISEKNISDYRDEFGLISGMISSASTLSDWMEIYRRLTRWEVMLGHSAHSSGLAPVIEAQLKEADRAFSKCVCRNFTSWLADDSDTAPVLSHRILERMVLPRIAEGHKVWLVVIDNFRYDQWLAVRDIIGEKFDMVQGMGCSLLPTSTQFCRNAILSGLLPASIADSYPHLWVDDVRAEGKNLFEEELLNAFFKRHRTEVRLSYSKVYDSQSCAAVNAAVADLKANQLNVVVVNFIDMLSHARSENRTVRELSGTPAAYRSITASWFRHSPLAGLFEKIAATGATVVLTTDHGTTTVTNPVKIHADADINDSLRYKTGRNLRADSRRVLEIADPGHYGLPRRGIGTSYLLCTENDFFVYPNNFRAYSARYSGTLQHGGISMAEMLVPLITLTPRIR